MDMKLINGVAALALIVGAIAFGGIALAGKNRATLGSDLSETSKASIGFACGPEPCVLMQAKLPARKTRAPYRGLVKRWRFETVDTDHAEYAVRLRVIRKVGPGEFKLLERSAAGVIPEDASGTFRFPANLKIGKRDFVGLELPASDNTQGFYVFGGTPGAKGLLFGEVPAGQSTQSPDAVYPNDEYLYNATIKRKRR